jgi:hypothetical protein
VQDKAAHRFYHRLIQELQTKSQRLEHARRTVATGYIPHVNLKEDQLVASYTVSSHNLDTALIDHQPISHALSPKLPVLCKATSSDKHTAILTVVLIVPAA